MAKSYKGVNLNGDTLMHYRTKGSRNGYSKNPNYRAVGQKATGRLVNGRYVYDNPYLSSYGKLKKAGVNEAVRSINNGAKNNWQQQANETSATNRMLNEHMQKRTTTVNMPNNNTTHKAMQKHNIFTKGWDGAVDNSYANASARVAAGKRVSTPQRTQVASAKSKRDKAIAKGAKNNWQQAGNLTRSMTEVARDLRNRYDLEQKAKSSGNKMTKQLTNFGSGQKSKEYEANLAYNSKKNPSTPSQTAAQKKSLSTHPLDENHYKTAMGTRIDTSHIVADPKTGNARYGTEISDPRYRVDGSQKIEMAKRIAAEKAANKTAAEKKAEQKRIEAGKKAREKRNSKKQSLISKIKGLFSKKK